MAAFEYRVLNTNEEFEQAHALEIAIWGLHPRDAVPVNLLRALQHSGGSLLGVYDDATLIGIALAFPARCDQRWLLWSHLTGVDRRYQGQGIGYALKCYQRDWALANGFDEMRWTFDPLQRGNANFNLNRLGAIANRYYENFYGVMEDEINSAASPSDRVEAIWRLRDPRLETHLNASPPAAITGNIPALLSDQGQPVLSALDPTQARYQVQIPRRLSELPDPLVWRLALREAFERAFANGYTAVSFSDDNAYLLERI